MVSVASYQQPPAYTLDKAAQLSTTTVPAMPLPLGVGGCFHSSALVTRPLWITAARLLWSSIAQTPWTSVIRTLTSSITQPIYTYTQRIFTWCSSITPAYLFSTHTHQQQQQQQQQQEQNPPEYSSDLRFGFLQGTFGLPYGGLLVQPAVPLRSTLTLSDSASMFSVIGTREEIIGFLASMRTMVFSQMSARTYTSDIVIELYRTSAQPSTSQPLYRRLLGLSPMRQLVIRVGRSFAPPMDFKPILRIQAPQGLRLCEVAGLLEEHHGQSSGAMLNLTRDKQVNIRVMGRSRSASLLNDHTSDTLNDSVRLGSYSDSFNLPPYEHRPLDALPPAYDFLHAN